MTEITTAGYEGLTSPQFFELLARHNVALLIDVRQAPISRKPGFSKSALTLETKTRGLNYLHIPALGCPREIRNAYRASGDWADYTTKFLAYLQTQQPEIQKLKKIVTSNRSCLMCFERDHNYCHRTFIAQNLAAIAPFQISHLTIPKGRAGTSQV